MGDIYQGEISKSLHGAGIYTRAIPTLPVGKQGKVNWGDADLICVGQGRAFFLEVKTANARLNLFAEPNEDGWRSNQRDFAIKAESEFGAPYYLAVVVRGINSPWPRINRNAFIVPLSEIEAARISLEQFDQKSIPYSEETTKLLAMRAAGCNMMNLWKSYMLEWKTGSWGIPAHHPIHAFVSSKLG